MSYFLRILDGVFREENQRNLDNEQQNTMFIRRNKYVYIF